MQTRSWKSMAGILILSLAALACGVNVSMNTPSPLNEVATTVAQTLAAFTAAASSRGPRAASVATPSATVAFTPLASSATLTLTSIPTSSGPQNSLVTTSTLCWLGPGNVYEVSSTIQKGARVELLGRGDVSGWWIVRNPKYHDPCWMPDKYLQIDSGVNVSALPIFYTPLTPTRTPTP